MQRKGLTTVAVVAVISLTAFAAAAYLLYAIPQSNADSLSRQVAELRALVKVADRRATSANQRAARADRRAASAEAKAASAGSMASHAFAKGHARGLADGAAESQSKYAAGYAAGNSAAFGQYGGNWSSGTAYLVLVRPGAGGSHQIAARAALQECQAVYAQNGSVYIQGPAC